MCVIGPAHQRAGRAAGRPDRMDRGRRSGGRGRVAGAREGRPARRAAEDARPVRQAAARRAHCRPCSRPAARWPQRPRSTSRRRASWWTPSPRRHSCPSTQGRLRERELFFECARSEQAKALIYAFFAERAVAKVPGLPAEAPPPVQARCHRRRRDDGRRHRDGVRQRRPGRDAHRHRRRRSWTRALATISKNYDSSVSRGRLTRRRRARAPGPHPRAGGRGGLSRARIWSSKRRSRAWP